MGKGTLLAKMDIKAAYRNVPVHPEDRCLLGMKWRDRIYIDKVLPFGLRSAPIIFTALADALQWLIKQEGVGFIEHYLDDYITIGKGDSDECAGNLEIMKRVCTKTGMPIEWDKVEGPATTISFLGMELDTTLMQIRLPKEKLDRLRHLTQSWAGRKAGKKRELLSLLGVLNHACKAVRQGRSFLRRLIDLASSVRSLDHFIRLNISAQSDILWWHHFAKGWNGISVLTAVRYNNPEIQLTSDASGNWGCGAFSGKQWLQMKWAGDTQHYNITVKELIPIVLAIALWGAAWRGMTVQARCDNAAVVHIINAGSSKDKDAMHLRRCLAFITAKYEINMIACHIQGVHNSLADAISRNKAHDFLLNWPQALPSPSPILSELLDLIIIEKPDWRSQRWIELWKAIFGWD